MWPLDVIILGPTPLQPLCNPFAPLGPNAESRKWPMKRKLSIAILGVFAALVLMGCQSARPDSKRREIVPGGIRYPRLLPEENVRPVTLKLRACPEFLTEADLKTYLYAGWQSTWIVPLHYHTDQGIPIVTWRDRRLCRSILHMDGKGF